MKDSGAIHTDQRIIGTCVLGELNELSTKKLIELYTYNFLKLDFRNCIYYCRKWNGVNGIRFKELMPEDFVIKVLGLIIEGRRKCYCNDYRNFKGSVYFHVRNELLTFFKCRSRGSSDAGIGKELTIESAETVFEQGAYLDCKNIFKKIENEELRSGLISLFDPDNEIEEIFVLEEILKENNRRGISEVLGILPREVTNIQKRIYRRIRKNKGKIRKIV